MYVCNKRYSLLKHDRFIFQLDYNMMLITTNVLILSWNSLSLNSLKELYMIETNP